MEENTCQKVTVFLAECVEELEGRLSTAELGIEILARALGLSSRYPEGEEFAAKYLQQYPAAKHIKVLKGG